MIGRPLTNSEFWQQLVAKNTGRTDPLRHRNKLLLLLAGLTGLRIRANINHHWVIRIADWGVARVCCTA